MIAREMFDVLAEQHRVLSESYGFTHTGNMPGHGGHVVWGLAHPDPVLYVADESGRFTVCGRERWEALTEFPPPRPWAGSGVTRPSVVA